MPKNKDDVKTVFNPIEYKNKFQRDNYDRVALNVPKGQKAIIKEFASSRGQSLNSFIWECIQKGMKE